MGEFKVNVFISPSTWNIYCPSPGFNVIVRFSPLSFEDLVTLNTSLCAFIGSSASSTLSKYNLEVPRNISSSLTMEDGEGAFAELLSSSLLPVSAGVMPLPALLLLLERAVAVADADADAVDK